MKGLSPRAWCILLPALALAAGCSSSQVVDDETAAEMALDEAGAPATEEALSEAELHARKMREQEAAEATAEESPRSGGGLKVLPPVEREEGDDAVDPDAELDAGDDEGGGSADMLPDASVGAQGPSDDGEVYEDPGDE